MLSYEEFIAKVTELPKIDTHEHITTNKYSINSNLDIFDLMFMPYNCDSLLSAGCSIDEWIQICNKSLSFDDRFKTVEKYLVLIRNITFFKAVTITLKELYGLKEYTLEECKRVDKLIKEEVKGNHYDHYFKKNNIEAVLTFIDYDSVELFDEAPVYPVPTVSNMVPRNKVTLEKLEKLSGVKIRNISNLDKAMELIVDLYCSLGVKALKFGSAYHRKLDFDTNDRQAASGILNKVMSTPLRGDEKLLGLPVETLSWEEARSLDDYMTHYLINLATDRDLTVVFHIGIHAWNENLVESCHATYLNKTIMMHKEARIVLLHGGIPYIEDAILLARYYPNVYIDMTWMHIISPSLTRKAVERYLELLPVNKIVAFGGDYCYIQNIYGNLEIAISNICKVFYGEITDENFTEEEALRIIKMWFYDNPKKIYKL